ncbi:MAG TPA: universal stress protein [Bryobacteraceae bacterium]
MLSKLLIPVDFSDRCVGAARFAIPVAERFHSEITLLHVAAPPDPSSSPNPEKQHRIQKRLRDFLPAAFAHLNVKRVLRFGLAAAEIVAYAAEDGTDLIMMPTRGYGAFRRMLLGSITAKVLHDAECPVWTGAHLAGGPNEEWLHPRTILCAADADLESEKALLWASQIAMEWNAELLLIHVDPRLANALGEDLSPYMPAMVNESNRKMEQLQLAAGTQARTVILTGDIPRAISEGAERFEADLVVIGRGGKSGRGRLGLNTYGIIRESGRPVVSV